jgi:hypothetical protein
MSSNVGLWEDRVEEAVDDLLCRECVALIDAMVVVLFVCEGRGLLDGNNIKN